MVFKLAKIGSDKTVQEPSLLMYIFTPLTSIHETRKTVNIQLYTNQIFNIQSQLFTPPYKQPF